MAFKMKSSFKKLSDELTSKSDTIQGMSMDQMTAKKKFQFNVKQQGLNPFSNHVKANTKVYKNEEGNYIYRYTKPSEEE